MKEKFPEEEELVLCTVDRILGTTVFVKIDEYGKEGIIATSEIAPGRIRNIRDYVVPNKKIVCKVLRIDEKTGNIDLSLRRVGSKERNKLLEYYEKERNILAILKIILKDEKKLAGIISKIKEKENIGEFFERAGKEELFGVGFKKEEVEQLQKILEEKTQRKKIILKMKIRISSNVEDGFEKIKEVLMRGQKEGVEITYLGAPNYLLTLTALEYKEANAKMEEIKRLIEEEAKKEGCKLEFFQEK